MAEARAFITQARKQRAEVEKARGFYQKGGSKDKDKEERIRKLKARLPCKNCRKLGHWKDDPQCPKNKHKKKKEEEEEEEQQVA